MFDDVQGLETSFCMDVIIVITHVWIVIVWRLEALVQNIQTYQFIHK